MYILLLFLQLAHQSLQQSFSVSNTALFPNATSTRLKSSSVTSCGGCGLVGEGLPSNWGSTAGSYIAEAVHITIINQNGTNITESHTVTLNYTTTWVYNNQTSSAQFTEFATNGIFTAGNQTIAYPTPYFVGGIYAIAGQEFRSSWSGDPSACFTVSRIPMEAGSLLDPNGDVVTPLPAQYSTASTGDIPDGLQIFTSFEDNSSYLSYQSSYLTAIKNANPALKDCSSMEGWFGDGAPTTHSAVFALTTTTTSYVQGPSARPASSLPLSVGPTSVAAEPVSAPSAPNTPGKVSSISQATSSRASTSSLQAASSLPSLAAVSPAPIPSQSASSAPQSSAPVSSVPSQPESPLLSSTPAVHYSVVADSSKVASQSASASPSTSSILPPVVLGGTKETANGAGQSVAGSHNLVSGAEPSSISGTALSIVPPGAIPASSFAAAISVGSQAITANFASQYLVSSQTLVAGSSITIGSGSLTTVIALQTKGSITQLVVGSDTSRIGPVPQVTTTPVLTIGTQAITANPSSQFVIEGQTLAPGSHPVTVSGTTYSIGPSASYAVINGATQNFAPAPSTRAAILTVGGSSYRATSGSNYVIGGQTLTPNGQITVSGSTVSLGPSASYAVINGATQTLVSAGTTAAPILTVGGTLYHAASGSSYTIGGQILTPNGQITVSGSTISLAPSASYLVINGATQNLTPSTTTPAPVLTIGNTPYRAASGSTYLIAGQTLTPNGQIIVSGSTISLAPSASYMVINGATTPLSPSLTTVPPLLTIGGSTYTANSATQYVIAGQTLSPGSVITVSGTAISLAQGATQVVVGSSTEALAPVTETTGLGGYIVSGLGGTATAGYTGSVYTGGAETTRGFGVWVMACVGVLTATFLL